MKNGNLKSSNPPIVLVTGSSQGLGAYLAQSFSKQGYYVLLHYRTNKAEAQKRAKKIKAKGIFQADLSSSVDVQRMAKQIKKEHGRLDCLVNNAGVYHARNLAQLSDQEWFEGLNSTASAVFLMTKALLPLLRRSASPRVINIGDSSCDRPTARDLAMGYHVGKTGVLMLTKSFAQSEARHGVTVNMVSPGWLENSLGKLSKKEIPAGRYGRFQDIANVVEFLIKPESNYINGSNIIVSGGWNLR
ncbi:MAG: SDR family oxidoreductase [Verrucomicrobiota bacterium]